MSDKDRQALIEALQARRKARGSRDPLARLSAAVNRAIAHGAPVYVEKPATPRKES